MVTVTWPRWPPCPYMAKTFTIFFGTRCSMVLNLCIDHQGLKVYKVYINDDPGLTLTNLTTWSNFVIKCLLCLYKTNSQLSVNRTIGPLVLKKIKPKTKTKLKVKMCIMIYSFDFNGEVMRHMTSTQTFGVNISYTFSRAI